MDVLLFSAFNLSVLYWKRRRTSGALDDGVHDEPHQLRKSDGGGSLVSHLSLPTLEATVETGSFTNSLRHNETGRPAVIPRTVSIVKERVHLRRIIVLLEAAGGTDKDPLTGHRRDTVPIVNAIVAQDCDSLVLQYQEEDDDEKDNTPARHHNAAVRAFLFGDETTNPVAGVIARVNPGTISPKTQAKFDAMLIELDAAGVTILSHPDVQRRMGAKDSLCKIAHLECGLPDTAAYYTPQELLDGFCKSIAFNPRVLKQNRGSQGEGIWICKLKHENYCKTFGERSATLDTPLVLMEANDNHVEEHTVGEFMEFCIHGRTEKSGEWSSTGIGRYLEGGIAEGAMLIDQRFLPRIVEGEVRVLMVGSNMVELVHKKPKAGGFSATLQSGAVYTSYSPDAPEFANLVRNFRHGLPRFMEAFGMEDQPLPLLWTADYIFGDKDADGQDTFYIGEFNCTCVGITQGLERAHLVAQTAIEVVFPEKE